jgi:serine protease Do
VTQGIVSAKGRTVSPREAGMQYQDYLQTDAAINPGNSGGPLLNLEGQIIGINSAIASRTGGYDGIGFAIPSNLAKTVLDNILVNGKLQRGFLGVEFGASTGAAPGAEVTGVMAESPADKAGLREGDVITKINGAPTNEQSLASALSIQAPGTSVKLEIVRDGQPKVVEVLVASFDQVYSVQEISAVGIKVRPLQDRDREVLAMQGHRTRDGVIVIEVKPGSVADGQLRPNDVIVGVDRVKVKDVRTFERAIASSNMERDSVQVQVIRGQERGFVMLGER